MGRGQAVIQGYASRTGTRRNLDALRAAGWGLVLTPDGARDEGFKRYFLDNGAWSAHTKGLDWNAAYRSRFERLVDDYGSGADFVVAPDIVAAGDESLARSLEWLPALRSVGCLVLIPVQDGMRPDSNLLRHLSENVGLFVGGSTEWKLLSLPTWAWVARELGCHLHVARVNTARRIRYCQAHGVDSFDGSAPSRYAVELPKLDAQVRQQVWMDARVGRDP